MVLLDWTSDKREVVTTRLNWTSVNVIKSICLLGWTSDKREQHVQSQELTQNQIGEGNKITSLGYR
ncbi:hypothetical protein C8R42DRAFT_683976 [Lentinula raphanica]|nr:hypothetical protein C8R42DRAFT_683976 [Lentinula raphanica]